MEDKNWIVQAWKQTSKKGRIIIILGLVSLLLIAFGVFLILAGVVELLIMSGGPNKDISGIIDVFLTGFSIIIVGVLLLIIYTVGMKFISSPRVHEDSKEKNA